MSSTILSQVKICSKCHQDFPATTEFFHRYKKSSNGLKPDCKKCRLEQEETRRRSKGIRSITHNRKDGAKCCSTCKLWLPETIEYFYRNSGLKGGFDSYCKSCTNQKVKKYRQENREIIKERTKKYNKENPEPNRKRQVRYIENHIEEIREKGRIRSKKARDENPEKAREKTREWIKNNPEKAKEATRRWQEKHPEKLIINHRNREAKKLAAEGTHTLADIEKQLELQKGKCYYCDCKLTKIPFLSNSQTVDHVVPLSRGGKNSPDNLVIACLFCNSSKHNKLLDEWLR